MVTSHFITHTQDYHTHIYSKNINFSPTPFSSNLQSKHKPFPRTGPQDLLVTHYDCEENEQKTLHNYAINQVSQCETEPQAIEITNVIATLYSKARATTVPGSKFTATFSEKKVHCSQVSNRNKNRLTTNHSTKVISNDLYI